MSDQEAVPFHLAYRMIREDISDLMSDCPDGAADRVPACPDWTVRETIGHLARLCWTTAARLDGSRDRPFPETETGLFDILDRWAEAARTVEAYAQDGLLDRMGVMTMDALSHELDIRRAVDLRMPHEHPAFDGVLEVVVGGLAGAIREHGLPSLRIETEGAHWQAGPGKAAGVVIGDRYDLVRSLTGRRTLAQVEKLTWTGSAETWWPAFTWGPFTPPVEPTEDVLAG